MIEWIADNNEWLGYVDNELVYKVAQDGTEDGWWYFEHLGDKDGMDGYNTAEDAKAEAEADYAEHNAEPELTKEDLDEMYADWLYHARRDDPEYF